MKRIIVSVMLMLLIFTAFGCNRGGDREGRRLRGTVINAEEALKLSEEYLSFLVGENYEEALKLCSEDIKEGAQKERGDLRLTGFMRENYNEAGNSIMINYKLSLVKKGEPRADLDDLSITVSLEEEDYKIT